MDLNDIFGSFFESFVPRFGGRTNDNTDGYNEGYNDLPFAYGETNRPFGSDFFAFEEDTQDIFHHFEEMFRDFGFGHQSVPPSVFSRDDEEPSSRSTSRHQSPRDQMLRNPDNNDLPSTNLPSTNLPFTPPEEPSDKPSWFSLWNSKPQWHWPLPTLPSTTSPREDSDLDDHVEESKLDDLLSPRNRSASRQNPSKPNSYFKSISIQTIRKPDGTVERIRTETDSDGNVTSTVTSTDPSRPPTLPLPPAVPKESLLGRIRTKELFEKLFGSSPER